MQTGKMLARRREVCDFGGREAKIEGVDGEDCLEVCCG
jgi:hypothetical protein